MTNKEREGLLQMLLRHLDSYNKSDTKIAVDRIQAVDALCILVLELYKEKGISVKREMKEPRGTSTDFTFIDDPM